MTVKASSTGVRILTVLDAVVRHQPVGVSELARIIDLDKSTAQRMLVTLEQQGWITADTDRRGKWRVTDRIRLLADIAFGGGTLKARARASLEELRDSTDETVSLIMRDGKIFRFVDVVECDHMLRVVPRVGQNVVGEVSATAVACAAFLSKEGKQALLGELLTDAVEQRIAKAIEKGYSEQENAYGGGTISLASAILDNSGIPVAVILLTAPTDRVTTARRKAFGRMIQKAAVALSDAP